MNLNSCRRFFLILVIFSTLSCHLVTRSYQTKGSPVIDVHLVEAFVQTVCDGRSDFTVAWLAHENSNWPFYSMAFHQGSQVQSKRVEIIERQRGHREQICSRARWIAREFPRVAQELSIKVTALAGRQPATKMFVCAPASDEESRAFSLGTEVHYAINFAHRDLMKDETLNAVTVHEFIHATMEANKSDVDAAESALFLKLYKEGLAMFGVGQILPNLKEHLFIGISESELVSFNNQRRSLFGNFLKAAKSGTSSVENVDLFFNRGTKAKPRSVTGFYVGYKVFESLGQTLGPKSAMATSFSSFKLFAEDFLERNGNEK